MTEKDIAKSISRHSVNAIVGLGILIVIIEAINGYFFASAPVSPILLIIFSIGGCMYTLQKVLIDLLVKPTEIENIKE